MKNRVTKAGVLIILTILTGTIFTGCMPGKKGGPEIKDKEDKLFPVILTEVGPGSITDYLKLNGDITTETDVDIYPDVAGKVINIYKEIGDDVKKGDILMKVDPSVPGMKYKPNPVRSTISGTITARYAQMGATVSQQQPVFKVGILDQLRIIVYIPERFVSKIRYNQTAYVTVDAYPGEQFKVKVVDISPVVDPVSRTMKVKMDFVKRNNKIKPGMFGTVKIINEVKKNVIVLDSETVVQRYDDKYVFVTTTDRVAEKRKVKTGIQKDGKVEIIDGIEFGEYVITSGQSLLDNEVKLKVMNFEDYTEFKDTEEIEVTIKEATPEEVENFIQKNKNSDSEK